MTSEPAAPSAPRDRNLVFISYSHADARWLARLRVHLKPLERHGLIVPWDDTKIKPGTQWREEIRTALECARAAVLLVSADFLASDFIAANELPPLLQAAEARGTLILPLILDHCRFEKTEGLSRFQAVNNPAKPLATLSRSRREAWFNKLSGVIEEALASTRNVPIASPREAPRPKEAGTTTQRRELAKRGELRLRFWEQLLDLARAEGLPFHANRSPNTSNWIGGKAGIPGYRWNYVIWKDNASAVELDIDTGDKRNNKRAFDALRSRKAEIEAAFGAPLEWQRLDDARRSSVRFIMREGGLSTPESEWPRIQATMVEAMARLSKAIQPHLQSRADASLKYQPLGDHLAARQNKQIVRLSFAGIEEIISSTLPASAHQYREWWSNQSDTSNRPQAAAWINAGFMVSRVDQENEWVEFRRATRHRTEDSPKLPFEMLREAIDTLGYRINYDPDPSVRGSAVVALAKLNSIQTVPHLIRALNDDIPTVRGAAANALGHIGGSAAVDALIGIVLNDASASVRAAAAQALGELGDSRALRVLEQASANDPEAPVRGIAAFAIGEINSQNGNRTKHRSERHPDVLRDA